PSDSAHAPKRVEMSLDAADTSVRATSTAQCRLDPADLAHGIRILRECLLLALHVAHSRLAKPLLDRNSQQLRQISLSRFPIVIARCQFEPRRRLPITLFLIFGNRRGRSGIPYRGEQQPQGLFILMLAS